MDTVYYICIHMRVGVDFGVQFNKLKGLTLVPAEREQGGGVSLRKRPLAIFKEV